VVTTTTMSHRCGFSLGQALRLSDARAYRDSRVNRDAAQTARPFGWKDHYAPTVAPMTAPSCRATPRPISAVTTSITTPKGPYMASLEMIDEDAV
jgi:hypothetical protein